MRLFEKMYQAAKSRDEKKLSKLLLKDHAWIDRENSAGLTPAALCASEGDFDTALWLWEKFDASIGYVYYGAILGGHIKTLDALYERLPKSKVGTIFKDDFRIAMAFAQLGNKEQLQQCFDKKIAREDELLKYAIMGAAFGNQADLLDWLLEKIKTNPRYLFECAIESAAQGGHQDLVVKLMKSFDVLNTKKNGDSFTFFYESNGLSYDAIKIAMRGFALGEHEALIDWLTTINGSRSDYYAHIAVRFAVGRNTELALRLAEKYDASFDLLYSAGISGDFNLLEKLITPDTYDFEIALATYHKAISVEIFTFYYLAHANDTALVSRICKAVASYEQTKDEIVESIDTIEENAIAVIELKQKYGLATKQAKLLFKHPDVLPLISNKGYDEAKIIELFKDTELNRWQLLDMIAMVRKNLPKAQLIDSLENYQNNTSTWWYNHLGRCQDFLTELKRTKNVKKCDKLVSAQFGLFDKTSVSETKSGNLGKHQKPIKQKDVKDGYYTALEEYCDTVAKMH
jgi:hypothetical protein